MLKIFLRNSQSSTNLLTENESFYVHIYSIVYVRIRDKCLTRYKL